MNEDKLTQWEGQLKFTLHKETSVQNKFITSVPECHTCSYFNKTKTM